MNTPGYESLANVLQRAYEQAVQGKGAERHANSLPFDKQPMQSISTLLNDHTGLLYQAMKKIQESTRMDKDAAVRELLGAINYCAGAVFFLEQVPKPILTWPDIEASIKVFAGQPGDETRPLMEVVMSKETGEWTCRHGNDTQLPAIVPAGEACPICFATK